MRVLWSPAEEPYPRKVTRVKNWFIHGAGGSVNFACENCGAPSEVTCDDANVMVTQFAKDKE